VLIGIIILTLMFFLRNQGYWTNNIDICLLSCWNLVNHSIPWIKACEQL
jgi:hypothetical protein